MAESQSNYQPMAVVGPQFLAQNPVDLAIVKKGMTLSEDKFVVTDVEGNIMFKIKDKLFNLRDRRVMLDAAGNPVLSFQRKLWSTHARWQIYRGDSSDAEDRLFSVKLSSLFQFKTSLHVFLASNTKEDVADFKVKGSWMKRSCTIYAGESTTIIAKMRQKDTFPSVLLGKEEFSVTVYPNVDYAFIVSLVAILDAINNASQSSGGDG